MTSLNQFAEILNETEGVEKSVDISKVDSKSSRYVVNIGYMGQAAVARCYKEISPKTRGMFHNEIVALNSLKNTFLKSPRVLFSDENILFQIVTFLEGKIGGNSLAFNREFVETIAPDFVSKYFSSLQKKKIDLEKLPQALEDRYLENIQFIEENWPNDRATIAPILEYIRKKKFMEDSMVISHGDANGGNFIFNNEGFGLIDWETVEYNSKSNDFATIYIASVLWPKWQKKFLESLDLTEKESFSFKYYVGFRLANLITKLNIMLAQKNGELFRSGKMTTLQIENLTKAFYRELIRLKL